MYGLDLSLRPTSGVCEAVNSPRGASSEPGSRVIRGERLRKGSTFTVNVDTMRMTGRAMTHLTFQCVNEFTGGAWTVRARATAVRPDADRDATRG